MSVIGFILLGIFLWFFYNLLVKVVLPVYKTTRRVRQQFNNMAEQRKAQHSSSIPKNDPRPPKQKEGEYIEFEEVK